MTSVNITFTGINSRRACAAGYSLGWAVAGGRWTNRHARHAWKELNMTKAWSMLKDLHRDERGAEGLEKLLIVAAIVLPLLGILIYFSKDIMNWVNSIWKQAKEGASDFQGPASGNPPPVN
jgi:Flp pilus assembly pilin Flp